MRLPLASDLVSRDGTVQRDAGTKNAVIEVRGESSAVLKRPGTLSAGSAGSGVGQLLACYNGELKSIIGNTLADLIVTTLVDNPINSMPVATNTGWIKPTFGDGVFLTIERQTGAVATSADGVSWSIVAVIDTSQYQADYWQNVEFGNGVFVATYSNDNQIFTSSNGVSWIDQNDTIKKGTFNIVFVNGIFVTTPSSGPTGTAVFYTSTNGVNWSYKSFPAGINSAFCNSCVYYKGKYYFLLVDILENKRIVSSSDFVSYSGYALPVSGNGYMLAVSGENLLFSCFGYSSDGTNWNVSSGVNTTYLVENSIGVAVDNSAFVIAFEPSYLDAQGVYRTTDNGKTWTKYYQHLSGTFFSGIAEGVGKLISVSDGSDISTVVYQDSSGGPSVSVDSSQSITSIEPSLQFFAEVAGQAQSQNVLFLKNAREAWQYNGTTLSKITDADYPGWSTVAPTSITRSGSTATVTLPASVNWQSGSSVTIAGAAQAEYNGTFVINVTDATHFTYQIPTTPFSIASITRVSSTATATSSAPHGLTTGNVVFVSGAAQAEYNGTFTVTVTSATTFTYTVSGTPATPATGTITAAKTSVTPATGTISIKGGRTTVPGAVYLDGYFFVMDQNAVIYNCGLGAPATWNALDFITANIEPGSGVAIAKSQNYVIALKSWSTEFFYDAGNPTGSPLSPVLSAFTLVGCASGESVANIGGTVMFVSKTRQKGRAVHMMSGQTQEKISTPDIERILNADTMQNVYSYGVRISGHMFYVLGLRDSGLTLVYDFTSKTWGQWTSLTARAPKSCTLSLSNGVVTATCAAHGLTDGDPVTIAGAAQAEYNGTHHAQYVDANTFKYSISGTPVTPATGTITAVGYDETYFKYTKYTHCSGRDLVLHETTGELCEITDQSFLDNVAPINSVCRTTKLDGGNEDRKTIGQIRVVGNKNGGKAVLRWSDDDYVTFSPSRIVNLSSDQARLRRCGSFRRRAFELRHIANAPIQVAALELEINQEK